MMTFDTGGACRRWIIPLALLAGLTAALSAGAAPTQIDLVLSAGDSWSQGSAEFYGFKVESMLP